MKKIVMMVERSKDFFDAYSDNCDGIYAAGNSIDEVKADAEKFLKEVTKAMNMEVAMKLEYFPNEGELYVELSGDDMGVLIGKRGQTLDSLQYLTSLGSKGVKDLLEVPEVRCD